VEPKVDLVLRPSEVQRVAAPGAGEQRDRVVVTDALRRRIDALRQCLFDEARSGEQVETDFEDMVTPPAGPRKRGGRASAAGRE